jgi:hypothetical protein
MGRPLKSCRRCAVVVGAALTLVIIPTREFSIPLGPHVNMAPTKKPEETRTQLSDARRVALANSGLRSSRGVFDLRKLPGKDREKQMTGAPAEA